MKKLRNAVVAFLIGAVALGAGGVSAGALKLFTGPAGSNPIQFPADLADLNNLINTLLSQANLGGGNSAVGSGLGISGEIYSQVGPTTALAAAQGGVTIATYTVPFNAFAVQGQSMRLVADWHDAANYDSKSFACGYGTAILTETITGTGDVGRCEMTITEGATANTVMVSGRMIVGTTATANVQLTPVTVLNSTTQSTATFFEVSNPTSAGDVKLDNFEIYYDNVP